MVPHVASARLNVYRSPSTDEETLSAYDRVLGSVIDSFIQTKFQPNQRGRPAIHFELLPAYNLSHCRFRFTKLRHESGDLNSSQILHNLLHGIAVYLDDPSTPPAFRGTVIDTTEKCDHSFNSRDQLEYFIFTFLSRQLICLGLQLSSIAWPADSLEALSLASSVPVSRNLGTWSYGSRSRHGKVRDAKEGPGCD